MGDSWIHSTAQKKEHRSARRIPRKSSENRRLFPGAICYRATGVRPLPFNISWRSENRVSKSKIESPAHPFHRIEFGPRNFFSKTCKFSIIFCWGDHFQKACRSRKKESKQSEITCKQSEPARTISEIQKKREFVRALCYAQCPKNALKRFYTAKGLLVLEKKLGVVKHRTKEVSNHFAVIWHVNLKLFRTMGRTNVQVAECTTESNMMFCQPNFFVVVTIHNFPLGTGRWWVGTRKSPGTNLLVFRSTPR